MRVLIDSSPLVALVDRSDSAHAKCVGAVKEIKGELTTTWPVVTEVMYLLRFSWRAQEAVWGMLEHQITIIDLFKSDLTRIRELMAKYKDLPIDLTDAVLVCVAERENIRDIFTLDKKDFNIYRVKGINRFNLIPG